MALHQVWLLPTFTAFYSILTLLLSYVAAYASYHLPSGWPLLSNIATRPPASCIHATMNNHLSILVSLCMFVKYAELLSCLRSQCRDGGFWERLANLNLIIGFIAAFSFQLSTNFPARHIWAVEHASSVVTDVAWTVYIFLHSFLSYFARHPSKRHKTLLIIRISLAVSLFSLSCSALKAFMAADTLSDVKKDVSTVAALSEWGAYYSLVFFLLTDSYEYRNMSLTPIKLIIPGSEQYEAAAASSGAYIRHRSESEFSSDFDGDYYAPQIR